MHLDSIIRIVWDKCDRLDALMEAYQSFPAIRIYKTYTFLTKRDICMQC